MVPCEASLPCRVISPLPYLRRFATLGPVTLLSVVMYLSAYIFGARYPTGGLVQPFAAQTFAVCGASPSAAPPSTSWSYLPKIALAVFSPARTGSKPSRNNAALNCLKMV